MFGIDALGGSPFTISYGSVSHGRFSWRYELTSTPSPFLCSPDMSVPPRRCDFRRYVNFSVSSDSFRFWSPSFLCVFLTVGSRLRSPHARILDNCCRLELATFNFLWSRISQQDVSRDLYLSAMSLAVRPCCLRLGFCFSGTDVRLCLIWFSVYADKKKDDSRCLVI